MLVIINFGVTLGVPRDYCEGAFGATFGVDWGHFDSHIGVHLGHFVGTKGSLC